MEERALTERLVVVRRPSSGVVVAAVVRGVPPSSCRVPGERNCGYLARDGSELCARFTGRCAAGKIG